MFKKNSNPIQSDIFGMQNTMPEELKKHAVESEEYHFYHIIFCNFLIHNYRPEFSCNL
jgi:hypothetical protein